MAILQANAVFTYRPSIANPDGSVTLHLTCAQPGEGSGLSGDFTLILTVADVTAVNAGANNAAKKALLDGIVQNYLIALYRLNAAQQAIQSSLNLLVGATVTVA